MEQPQPDYPAERAQTGMVGALAAGGVVVSVVTAALVERWWIYVLGGLVGLAVGLGAVALLGRRLRRSWDRIERGADLRPLRSPAAAVRIGAWRGAATVVAALAVFWVESLVFDDTTIFQSAGMVILSIAGALALVLRSLRRWQDERGLLVCVRTGASRLTWTRSQGRAQMVVVPRPADAG